MKSKWLQRGVRSVVVLAGVIVLTSFSIDATDTLRDSNTLLSQLSAPLTNTSCPEGMVEVTASSQGFCIDAYENSYSSSCPYPEPHSIEEAKVNADARNCTTASLAGTPVAAYATYQFAETMCAKRGARLPNAGEWHEAAIGTPDTDACNTSGRRAASGAYSECRSLYGVYDMVGNVWEWVAGDVTDGTYDGTKLASEGYVQAVDTRGLPTESSESANPQYNSDYTWSESEGSYGMMRGGFYGSENDAGLFSVHAKMSPSYGSEATGFRCAQTRG